MDTRGFAIVYFEADNAVVIHNLKDLHPKVDSSGDHAEVELVGQQSIVEYPTYDDSGIEEKVTNVPYKCITLFAGPGKKHCEERLQSFKEIVENHGKGSSKEEISAMLLEQGKRQMAAFKLLGKRGSRGRYNAIIAASDTNSEMITVTGGTKRCHTTDDRDKDEASPAMLRYLRPLKRNPARQCQAKRKTRMKQGTAMLRYLRPLKRNPSRKCKAKKKVQLISVPGQQLYQDVKVSGLKLASLLQMASRDQKLGIFLTNGLTDLLFTKEELATSSGQGLRGNKDNALSKVKVAAMKEYLFKRCQLGGWATPNKKEINARITNKIGNAKKPKSQMKKQINNNL